MNVLNQLEIKKYFVVCAHCGVHIRAYHLFSFYSKIYLKPIESFFPTSEIINSVFLYNDFVETQCE